MCAKVQTCTTVYCFKSSLDYAKINPARSQSCTLISKMIQIKNCIQFFCIFLLFNVQLVSQLCINFFDFLLNKIYYLFTTLQRMLKVPLGESDVQSYSLYQQLHSEESTPNLPPNKSIVNTKRIKMKIMNSYHQQQSNHQNYIINIPRQIKQVQNANSLPANKLKPKITQSHYELQCREKQGYEISKIGLLYPCETEFYQRFHKYLESKGMKILAKKNLEDEQQ